MAYQQLTASDGHHFAAYHAPPVGKAWGGLLVVQEIFGVNSHIRSVADGYAAEGLEVLAPPLFDRVERGVELDYSAGSIERGRRLAEQLGAGSSDPATGMAGTVADLEACVNWLHEQGHGVGLVGYCFGGTLAWVAAGRLEGLDAAVGYYGGLIQKMLSLEPRCPLMLHFGERDEHIPLENVDAIEKAFPDLPVFRYPAEHGFNCEQRASYDRPAADLARRRTLDFLKEHLG